ncbi:hypothetical protein ABW19_dt0205358 [Dactylella cylindrospora]|nr:hypothetical protein ABW19_dt0205358 [Dactylella cylindrospora]
MDTLPPEILIQIFKHFDSYTVLTRFRPVSKSFAYATAILIPSLRISRLPPSLWEKILSNIKSYRTLRQVSQTSASFHSLLHNTKLPGLQAATFRLPLECALSSLQSDSSDGAANPGVADATPTAKILEHPAFENICCRIELGGLIYHKTGNSCPTNLLTFPVADENATHPPVDKVLVKFSARYGVKLRPVLVTKEIGDKDAPGKGVTVGEVYHAMRRLFVEPLTEKQAVALKEMREWEARKHEAVKKAVSKLDSELATTSASTTDDPQNGGTSSGNSSGQQTESSSEPNTEEAEKQAEAEEEPKEPVIEHDESAIHFSSPISVEFTGHQGDKTPRQREFLKDFPYVYASAHMGSFVDGAQEFVLTYH